ncbi:YwiC-like family protein [Roseimaritima sediminicola]|uniref:YwiC-like family protein n=1 Tax=Roseimaritima sediminicola TaxID=2662066 RepID=UPI001298561C|nr:YwiC-like family protein [Roseimaritima sediminicola]
MSSATAHSPNLAHVAAKVKLQPKEHGAYAVVGIPLITALMIAGQTPAGLTLAGLSIAVATITGFLAHEPLLVAFGHRGSRAQRTTPAALRQLGWMLGVTLTSGVLAVAASDAPVRWALVGCGAAAVVGFVLAAAGHHRTLGGQLWGLLALSAPFVPILLASSLPLATVLEAWGTWLLGFTATNQAVRGVIAAQKRHRRTLPWTVVTLLSLLVVGSTLSGFAIPIVTLPMLLITWYLLIDPPHAKHLKRLGWALVLGTVATAIWMVWML